MKFFFWLVLLVLLMLLVLWRWLFRRSSHFLCFFIFALGMILLARVRMVRISFQNDDIDGCTAAVIESEDGPLVDVRSGDDQPNQADEADGMV